MRAARLREVEAGDDAELGGKRLEHHRHDVRQQDDRQQGVAERRSAGEVGRPIAGVHIADRDEIAGAGEGAELAPERCPAPVERRRCAYDFGQARRATGTAGPFSPCAIPRSSATWTVGRCSPVIHARAVGETFDRRTNAKTAERCRPAALASVGDWRLRRPPPRLRRSRCRRRRRAGRSRGPTRSRYNCRRRRPGSISCAACR